MKSTPMASVSLNAVTKVYAGNVVAVDGLNLEIQQREFVVIVGPSGCGKTTTLRLIAGLEALTGGTIRIGDRVVNKLAPKDRHVAMVFQNYALYPHMTVFDNMAFGLKQQHQRPEIRDRVGAAAETLGISDLLQRHPNQLSGGQQQRVAFGRAIVRRPDVFLFDEPLSNLDANMRSQMRIELKRLHAELTQTMIYVTHDQTEAMTLGDRIVVMKDGMIQQVAEPRELYNHPVNTFVATFIGMPPMNLFSGVLRRTGETLSCTFASVDIEVPLPTSWQRIGEKYVDRQVLLGVRPEDILITDAARSSIAATVDMIESTGSDSFVHVTRDSQSFVSRVDPAQRYDPGQEVRLELIVSRAHLFDADTRIALT